jgi:uncharacterized protein (TIGR02001 family)
MRGTRGDRMKVPGSGAGIARPFVRGVIAATLVWGAAVQAQEVNPTTGEEMPCIAPPSTGTPDIQFSFGVGFTSNYISKGLTQTDNDPAIQPYMEVGYGIGYVGLWASNVSFGGVSDTELDVSIGIRPEFGDLSLDLGFVQYFYQKDDADYGEAYLFATYALNDQATVKAQYYREVYAEKDWL